MSAPVLSLFLRAVALVESANNPHAVGAAGERGRFQMTPAVVAECGGYGEREARLKIERLEKQLLHMGVEPLPFNLYLAWNAGPGAVQRGQVPEVTYQRAVRVVATMEALSK